MMSDPSEHWVPIKSTRLLITPFTLDSDVVSDMFETRSFESVHKWSVHPPWKSQDDAVEWVTAKLNFPINFGYTISLLDDSVRPPDCPRYFGMLGLTSTNELGYQLHPAAWGQGFASEAVSAMLAHAFANPGLAHLDEVEAYIAVENEASARVLRKCRFVRREVKLVDDVKVVDVAGDAVELSAETVADLRKAVVDMGVDMREGEWERAPPTSKKKKISLEVWVTNRMAWREAADVDGER